MRPVGNAMFFTIVATAAPLFEPAVSEVSGAQPPACHTHGSRGVVESLEYYDYTWTEKVEYDLRRHRTFLRRGCD